MAEHDSGYKLLFSHKRMVEELLRGFVRERWAENLHFGTLERAGGSFTSADLRERHSDMAWRLRWRGGPQRGRPSLLPIYRKSVSAILAFYGGLG